MITLSSRNVLSRDPDSAQHTELKAYDVMTLFLEVEFGQTTLPLPLAYVHFLMPKNALDRRSDYHVYCLPIANTICQAFTGILCLANSLYSGRLLRSAGSNHLGKTWLNTSCAIWIK